MEPLESYGVITGDKVQIESKALGIARVSIVGNPHVETLLKKLTELQLSYFNQFGFTIKAYVGLHKLFLQLNSADDRSPANQFSPYDLMGENLRDDLQKNAYLFIVTLRTLLDLYVGIVDFALYKTVRPEDKIPALGTKLPTSGYGQGYEAVNNELQNIKNIDWVKALTLIRHNVMHRGFLLVADLGFHKQERLVFKQERGVGGALTHAELVDIGTVLHDFITNWPAIDQKVANLLIDALGIPEQEQSAKAIFAMDGGMTILYHDGISQWS